MKLFITGGTGFIGRKFINKVLDAGHVLVVQKRNSNNLYKDTNNIRWVNKDLDEDFKEELIGCDVFIHLAAHTPNHPYDSLENCIYWNVYSTVKIIQQAIDSGITNFLIAGTAFEYGSVANEQEYVHPASACSPYLSYPVSKALCSTALVSLAKEKKIKLKILRIFQVYGEGELESRLYPSLLKAIKNDEDFYLNSGNQIRDFIKVEKVVEKFIKEMNFNTSISGRPEIINVGTGEGKSVFDFSQEIWRLNGGKGKIILGENNPKEGSIFKLVANINEKKVF